MRTIAQELREASNEYPFFILLWQIDLFLYLLSQHFEYQFL